MNQESQNGTTKNCPKCGEEIQNTAKKCKHCQADLRNWFVRHKILTGILVVIVIMIIASLGGGNDENKEVASSDDNTVKTEDEKAEKVLYKIAEPINTGELELTITSVEEKKQVGSQYFNSSPSEGGTYVAVAWKYKNTSSEPIGAFSQPRINLVDSNGVSYDADINASSNYATELDNDNKIISDLNPGITVKDANVFEISKDNYTQGKWNLVVKANGDEYEVEIK
jgi:hypothetical protein